MIKQRFFNEVFYYGVYKPAGKLKGKNNCIDLGACTGEFSLWVNQQFNHIYSIEGHKDLFPHLKENVSDFSNIHPFHMALGDWNGSGHMEGGTDGGARLSKDQNPTEDDIPVMTLAKFMEKEGISYVDCLKVDIENGEYEVFHSEDFPSVANKIGMIIGEHVPTQVGGLLKGLGFKEIQGEIYYYKR